MKKPNGDGHEGLGGLRNECRPEWQLGLSGERVNSSSTDTGLGCCCSPLTTEHFTSGTVRNLSSKPIQANAGDGDGVDGGGGSVKRTVSMIFFSAFRSSSHRCNAPRSFCLFSATVSGGSAGAASSPISLATSAGASRRLSTGGALTLDSRISAGKVGLLGTSDDSLRSSAAGFEFPASAGFLLIRLFPENKDKGKE